MLREWATAQGSFDGEEMGSSGSPARPAPGEAALGGYCLGAQGPGMGVGVLGEKSPGPKAHSAHFSAPLVSVWPCLSHLQALPLTVGQRNGKLGQRNA